MTKGFVTRGRHVVGGLSPANKSFCQGFPQGQKQSAHFDESLREREREREKERERERERESERKRKKEREDRQVEVSSAEQS